MFGTSLKNRQRVERRSSSLLDPKRRGDEEKLIPIESARLLRRAFKVKIVENIHAHRDERESMERIGHRWWKACWRHVIWPVAADERNTAIFQEVLDVGMIASEAA